MLRKYRLTISEGDLESVEFVDADSLIEALKKHTGPMDSVVGAEEVASGSDYLKLLQHPDKREDLAALAEDVLQFLFVDDNNVADVDNPVSGADCYEFITSQAEIYNLLP